MDYYIIWLVVMVVFLVIEALTVGLITIWFALGAFLSMILALLGVPVNFQIVVFIIVSTVSLVFLYPLVRNKLKTTKIKTNYEALIDKKGLVIETVDNIHGKGQVKVDGQIWTARSSDDTVIDKGKLVLIEAVQGVKLIVKSSL